MCSTILKVRVSCVCVWGNNKTFDILIGIKDVLKVIDNWFSTPIIFENTLKTRVSIRNIQFGL